MKSMLDLPAFAQGGTKQERLRGGGERYSAKLLKTYKRCTKAIQTFDDEYVLPTERQASGEDDLSTLRTWCEHVRTKMVLVQRAQSARAEHHAQFYAGGDANHCLFIDVLHNESFHLEHLAQLLEDRAYEITMKESEADWVLSAPGETIICDEPRQMATPPSTPPHSPTIPPSRAPKTSQGRRRQTRKNAAGGERPPTPPPEDTFEQQFWAQHDAKATFVPPTVLLDRLRAYLKPPVSLPASIESDFWHAAVSQLFRIVILRSPELAPLALSMQTSDVESFLDRLERDISGNELDKSCRVTKLWQRMKFAKAPDAKSNGGGKGRVAGLLGVQTLRDAIADVCRSERLNNETTDKKARIKVLGGWVWKTSSAMDLPSHGWDLFYQFVACSGCALSVTKTFKSLARQRQLAVLGAYPAWLAPNESPTEHIMRLSNVVLCSCNRSSCSAKIKRVEQKATKTSKKKTVYTEEWERPWMYVKMPRDDPSSTAILDQLACSNRFVVLAQRSGDDEPTHKPSLTSGTRPTCSCCRNKSELWLSKIRSGLSPNERKNAHWTVSSFFPVDKALSSFANTSSETRHGHRYTDCYDALIMDNQPYPLAAAMCGSSSSEAMWQSFLGNLGAAILQAKKLVTVMDLYEEARDQAIKQGEPLQPSEVEVDPSGDRTVHRVVIEEDFVARNMFREDVV
ncbi:hypothetical protein ACM66B_001159 [Microbotryomycetes sp. NB124-2]